MAKCVSCPRYCGVDRENGERGFCGASNEYIVAFCGLHYWEEPCISGKTLTLTPLPIRGENGVVFEQGEGEGKREEPCISGQGGSGTIFFSGCNLKCVFCQNRDISRELYGEKYSEDELIGKMLELQNMGANNINLVTPTPYALMLAKTLKKAKPLLNIPIVYNCGGYESPEALAALEGLVDIYLPDFKYFSDDLASEYSKAPDYAKIAGQAISEMLRQVGELTLDENGIAKKGLIVRHLVLPACREDSKKALKYLSEILPAEKVRLSLMCQYTPDFADENAPKNLKRRLTSFEYDDVLEYALSLGFDGFSQEREAANKQYTPNFKK